MSALEAADAIFIGQEGRPPEYSINSGNGVVSADDVSRISIAQLQDKPVATVVDASMTNMVSPAEGVDEGNRGAALDEGEVRVLPPGQEGSSPKISFMDKLLGGPGGSFGSSSITELDVDVRDEDVRIGVGNGMPEIWFSNRVHDAIDAKLEKSMIIRLLDRAIGYRALWNRIVALWRPNGEINLIDLDNGYYLVRFAVEDDFHKVFAGGPWVIYGSYLTVQPWNRFFNTDEVHPSHIMVWVRLPKLPYRYYTKSLFKYIAATIGKVVRVDCNTSEGKRGRFARLAIIVDLSKPLVSGIMIDGRRQDIEYEGLPSICFKCGKYGHAKELCGVPEPDLAGKDKLIEQRDPKELYGPWMQVANRRRRTSTTKNSPGAEDGQGNLRDGTGSRFSVLSEERGLAEESLEVGKEDENRDIRVLAKEKVVLQTSAASVIPIVPESQGATMDRPRSSQGDKVDGGLVLREVVAGSSSTAVHSMARHNQVVVVTDVASIGTLVKEPSTLNSDKHDVVRVDSMGEGRETRQSKGRVLPATVRGLATGGSKSHLGVKWVIKVGSKLHKRDDPAVVEEKRRVQSRSSGTGGTNQVEWQTNSIFQQSGGSDMQGAYDPGFFRCFKLLVKKQVPDIVVIMEPRVSGKGADRFIRKSGFEFSYRVEAHGFSGGIWLLWQASVQVEIIAISNHPNAQRRRNLWEQLLALNPGVGRSWVVGGDLNVISSSEERLGGSQRRLGICHRFNDFLFDSGLLDMGFSGSKFTWRRGNLYHRLDRCLSNSDWVSAFPTSEVHHIPKISSDHGPILLDTEFLEYCLGGAMDYCGSVARFQDQSRRWNMDVFGHIEKRKNKLLARIKGVERALDVSYRQSLVELEETLHRELDIVLEQEESLWLQKSRINWIQQGDRNTKYFHLVTKRRHKQNTV
ncbi:hypothetical protein GQ457_18G015180 [Hibiscus cannabinus]